MKPPFVRAATYHTLKEEARKLRQEIEKL